MTAVGCSFGYPPTTTRGILSKIIGAEPVLLQSSAAVFSGMSGGLLSSDESGKPLGMLLCNTRYRRGYKYHDLLFVYSMWFSSRDDTLSVIHSNISFALPFSFVIEPLKLFLHDEGSIFNSNVVAMIIWF